MDKVGSVVIHCNAQLLNQCVYTDYLISGFQRLGINAFGTSDTKQEADIHVCIGPHYALRDCIGKPTLYIDRCLWGDDMEFVTIGWLDSDGKMIYPNGSHHDRLKPHLEEWKEGEESALFLLDYGPYPREYYDAAKKIYKTDLRPHPSTGKGLPPLKDHLSHFDIAIGFRTSALFTAVTEGVPVVSLDSTSSVYNVSSHSIGKVVRPDRGQWLNDMSYAQWSGLEIQSGEALKYALDNRTNTRAGNPARS